MSWTYKETQTVSDSKITFSDNKLGKFAFGDAVPFHNGEVYQFPAYQSDNYYAIQNLLITSGGTRFFGQTGTPTTSWSTLVIYRYIDYNTVAQTQCVRLSEYRTDWASYIYDYMNSQYIKLTDCSSYTDAEVLKIKQILQYCTKID